MQRSALSQLALYGISAEVHSNALHAHSFATQVVWLSLVYSDPKVC